MAGVNVPHRKINSFSTNEDVYRVLRTAASTFQLAEFGLTCAKLDTADNRWTTRSYNILISWFFPPANGGMSLANQPDRQITLSHKTLRIARFTTSLCLGLSSGSRKWMMMMMMMMMYVLLSFTNDLEKP